MKKVIYSKFSRDRKEEFRIRTSIIEENGKRYVIKSADSTASKKHIQSLKNNYDILRDFFGSIKVVSCTNDTEGVRFEYIEGQNLTEKIIEFYKDKETDRAEEIIAKVFGIIDDKAQDNVAEYKGGVFGGLSFSKPMKAISPACLDCYFNNILIDRDDNLYLIDYEWLFDVPLPINYIFYRSLSMLNFDSNIEPEYVLRCYERFGINEEQIAIFEKMERRFEEYVRGSGDNATFYDWSKRLGNPDVSLNLNYLAMNNPQLFPDYGNGFSEATKKVLADFDFRSGYLDTRVIFDRPPKRIRFDPADGLCCVVSDVRIIAGGEELPVSCHNGSDDYGVILFETTDSNIYYENPGRHRSFAITAKINGYNNEKITEAIEAFKTEHYIVRQKCADYRNRCAEYRNQCAENWNKYTQASSQLSEMQKKLWETEQQIQTLSQEKKQAYLNAENMRISAEQWREAYKSVCNSKFWKITFPLRKLLDLIKSGVKKKTNSRR